MTEQSLEARWSSAWPDALAFGLGLGVAWMAGWTTTDLVWSLWLSSLVVGYSTIVWTIVRPGVDIVRGASRDRALIHQAVTAYRGATVAGIGILVFIGLFMLAFFTIHFGGFHYVHSQFLYMFFPLDGNDAGRVATAGMSTYVEVVRRYWLFLPSAFLAERAGFLRQPQPTTENLAVTPMAIAARKAANARRSGAMMAPYRNVMRMHGLIFFFALAHFAHLDSFIVYAVVYAVYFFPWRLVKGRGGHGVPGRQGGRGTAIELP